MSIISDATKERWLQQIQVDYPHMPEDMLRTVLDLYQTDRDFIEDKIKALKKLHKGPVFPKTQLTVEELERLNEMGLQKQEELQKTFEGGVKRAEEQDQPENIVTVE